MESTGKYWIPVFNIFEKTCWVTLAHPEYTKPQKVNKTDRKDAKWICDLYMCGMSRLIREIPIAGTAIVSDSTSTKNAKSWIRI